MDGHTYAKNQLANGELIRHLIIIIAAQQRNDEEGMLEALINMIAEAFDAGVASENEFWIKH